jgi:hypothetical protein
MAVKGLAIMLAPKGGKAKKEAEEPIEPSAGDTGKRAAIEDAIDAFKSGDVDAALAAMTSFVELCGYAGESDEETTDDL